MTRSLLLQQSEHREVVPALTCAWCPTTMPTAREAIAAGWLRDMRDYRFTYGLWGTEPWRFLCLDCQQEAMASA